MPDTSTLQQPEALAPSMTITEALQEIKTIGKRLEKKKQAIVQYVARDVRIKDPLEASGGSAQYITRERQSISDLEQRIIDIRSAIQRSNLDSILTIDGEAHSVADWLNWRREVAEGQKQFASGILGAITKLRIEAQKQGGRVVFTRHRQRRRCTASAPGGCGLRR